jgi:putative DNA primase/helicase
MVCQNASQYVRDRASTAPARHLRQHEEKLLVPLYDGDQLVNLQRIGLEGDKRFLYGGKIVGCSSSLGPVSDRIQIVEGWAAACTIFGCTGQHTAAAMSAGNLKAVALHYRRRYPDLPITIAADNDRCTPGNPGIKHGTEAARAVNGQLVWPTFPDGADGPPATFWLSVKQAGIRTLFL